MNLDGHVSHYLLEERGHLLDFNFSLVENIEVGPLVVEVDVQVVVQLGAGQVEVLSHVFLSSLVGSLLIDPILRIPLLAAGAIAAAFPIDIVFFLLGEPVVDQESHQLVSLLSGVVLWNVLDRALRSRDSGSEGTEKSNNFHF